MYVKGTVLSTHTTTLPTTRRGPKTLTSIWITDDHDRADVPSKQPAVLWEVQFLDTASRCWSAAIDQFLDPGQRVIAEITDIIEPVHVERDTGDRTFIKARGIDIADSLLDPAKTAAGRD